MLKIYLTQIRKREGESRREAEKRAVRLCLDSAGVTGNVAHHRNGAPFIEDDESCRISVTHSAHWAAVAVGSEVDDKFGIDVEDATRPQLAKVITRVLSEPELVSIDRQQLGAVKGWTAKEAVYKAIGQTGVDMKNDINLFGVPFNEATFGADKIRLKLSFEGLPHDNVICIASLDNNFEIITL